ncbi:MAG: glycosyltransferase [Candidatus Aminicenantes bacterium]|nr:glycosyltransferase [Candidatus Aminicenantes bacterium]
MKRSKILISAFACHPSTSSGFEGEEKILGAGESVLGWNLVKQIGRRHDVWVITQRRNRKGVERAVSQGEMAGVQFHYTDFPGWPRSLWYHQVSLHFYYYFWQIRAYLLARRLHRRFRFDAAHHITFANYWMPSFIGAFLPIPFIWGPMGGGQRTPKGFLPEYPLSGKLEDLERGVSQWIGRKLLWSRQRCMKRARAILVCNQDTKVKFPAKYQGKIHFFPVTGIGIEDVAPASAIHASSGGLQVLTTGRLVFWKNFAESIKAFAVFSRDFPESRFTIVGEGPEGQRLHDLVTGLGVQDKVQFVPWLPQKELWAKMRASHIFLYPSLREGGGAVVIEAMASGLPVICLDSAGPGFHIQENWGIKIAPRNPEFAVTGMAEALGTLARDPDLRLRLSRASRQRAEEFYVWDRLGDRLQGFYAEALNEGDS